MPWASCAGAPTSTISLKVSVSSLVTGHLRASGGAKAIGPRWLATPHRLLVGRTSDITAVGCTPPCKSLKSTSGVGCSGDGGGQPSARCGAHRTRTRGRAEGGGFGTPPLTPYGPFRALLPTLVRHLWPPCTPGWCPLVPPSLAPCAGALQAVPLPERAYSSRASALKPQDVLAAVATAARMLRVTSAQSSEV